MEEAVDPILKQMWAMSKLLLEKSNRNCIIFELVKDGRQINQKITNKNFDQFFPFCEKHKSGIIRFCCDISHVSFRFIYSFESDCVAYTPHEIVGQNTKEVALNLFCEAEFLVNIDLYSIDNA